jgi:hypothetical protein
VSPTPYLFGVGVNGCRHFHRPFRA